jgi:DNA-directed RNA polymerase subunit K/omega
MRHSGFGEFENSEEVMYEVANVPDTSFNLIARPKPSTHRSSPYLTIHEWVVLLGVRQEQLELGATPHIPLLNMTTAYEIALSEMKQKMINLNVERIDLDGNIEILDIRDMKFEE